jgi:hypothetical protein
MPRVETFVEEVLMPRLKFEQLTSDNLPIAYVYRTPVPGGWFIVTGLGDHLGGNKSSVTFYPDPHHSWDGGSIELPEPPKPPPKPHKREP